MEQHLHLRGLLWIISIVFAYVSGLAQYANMKFHSPYEEGTVSLGSSLESLRKRSAVHCGLACLDRDWCVSYNYGKRTGACQLKSHRLDDGGKAFEADFIYYELSRDGT